MAALDEATLDIVREAMRAKLPRIPQHFDRVFKDESNYSFDTPFSLGGLYINLHTWQAFSKDFVKQDSRRSGNRLYLHETWHKVPIPEEEKAELEAKPEKLAIGVQGGFQTDAERFAVEKTQQLVVVHDDQLIEIALPAPDLPEIILNSIEKITAHDSAGPEEDNQIWEEERKVSRYADSLEQLPEGMGKFGRHIPSDASQWQCDETGVRENLWLNLSTGFIGSGRQNFDGTGGNGAALRHFEATGKKYPLVVKLGTITPQGADVYSYAEDESDMVLDPHLALHLAHWGINRMALQKTEKTMAELQIDLNMAFEFDKITEQGSTLQPLFGPGLVGLKNLGNSCYMNSVLQLLWMLPPVQQRYAGEAAKKIFETSPIEDVSHDFPTQMAKLGVALTEARTGEEAPPLADGLEEVENGDVTMANASKHDHKAIKPRIFKALVGRGNSEFSSARQQDAVEYFQHLLEVMTKAERMHAARLGTAAGLPQSTADSFSFETEDRIECAESHAVSYRRHVTTSLGLDIPLSAATNKEELQEYKVREAKRAKLVEAKADAFIGAAPAENVAVDTPEEPVLPKVPFAACLERWAGDEIMDDYYSAALGRRTRGIKRTRFATFSPYLFISLKRYYVSKDWVPKKMEVLVDVPEKIDLEYLRSRGMQPGEVAQPEDAAADGAAAPAAEAFDQEVVSELMAMGFTENGSVRAAIATKGGTTASAMEWVLSHIDDPDFNDPLPAATAGGSSAPAPDAAAVEQLSGMGFTAEQARAALTACDNSMERAVDWLFSHPDDLDAAVAAILKGAALDSPTAGAPAKRELDDGPGKYTLIGFISHMGSNTSCGHYVCHIKKGSQWVIFNDEKVAVSERPPRDIGYAYLFKRNDVQDDLQA